MTESETRVEGLFYSILGSSDPQAFRWIFYWLHASFSARTGNSERPHTHRSIQPCLSYFSFRNIKFAVQSNASFPAVSYGYSYESQWPVWPLPHNPSFQWTFPHPLASLPDPIVNCGSLDGPGSWLANDFPQLCVWRTKKVQRAKRLTTEE